MAVVVARRAGLHVAATRFASAGPLDPAYRDLRRRVLAIEDAVLSACRPGARYGDALRRAGRRVRRATARQADGPVITRAARSASRSASSSSRPARRAARWYREPIAAGHAVAWNPSLPGGAKAEDTYLVTGDGELTPVTSAPGWPAEPDDGRHPPRPGVLEVGT